MALSRRETESLLHAVSLTRTNEVNCDECMKELAEFAERSLAGRSIVEGFEAIEHHLAICPECQEEYEALLTALKASDSREG